MPIRNAVSEDFDTLNSSFQENDYNKKHREWLCRKGLKAAIKRKEVIVECKDGTIIAACRVYRRKRDGGLSIYQRFGNITTLLKSINLLKQRYIP